jgi:transketolase
MLDDISDKKVKFLEEKSLEIRELIIGMLLKAKSGHTAGPLGLADIFSVLYFHTLNHFPHDPDWEDRDRLILSNGHVCPVRYASMALSGYFPLKELDTLRQLNTRLQGHPHRSALPGLETTSGPLGEGISQAIGIALSAKLDKKDYRVYVVTGDGEHDEGNIWESIMMGARYKLDNLAVIIDRNNIQIDGFTENVMPLDDLKNKYESFGWVVFDIDGNNIRDIADAFSKTRSIHEKPVVIIAHTVPGKGVDFMQNDFKWHGMPPQEAQAKIALKELRTLKNKIENDY